MFIQLFSYSVIQLFGGGSFFNKIPAQIFENNPRLMCGFDWFFMISLLFLLLLAVIKLNFAKTTKALKKTMRGNYKINIFGNESAHINFPLFPFILCICIVFSLAFYSFFYQSHENIDDIFFLKSFIVIMGFIIGRFVLVKFVGLLFKIKNIISEFEQITTIMIFLATILCFPFIFIAYYYDFPLFLTLALLIFALIFLYRIGQGWIIFRKRMKIYEYFLYFCTIEILPLLVFFKLVTNRLLII